MAVYSRLVALVFDIDWHSSLEQESKSNKDDVPIALYFLETKNIHRSRTSKLLEPSHVHASGGFSHRSRQSLFKVTSQHLFHSHMSLSPGAPLTGSLQNAQAHYQAHSHTRDRQVVH